PEGLPPAVRRFLDEAAGRSDLWPRFPDDALLAAGARTGAAALADLVGAFLTKAAFGAVQDDLNRGLGAALGGKRVAAEGLPPVGPDWGLGVGAPPPAEKRWFPSVVFAVRLGAGDRAAPLDRAAVGTLHSYALLAVLGHNRPGKDPLSLKTLREDRAE